MVAPVMRIPRGRFEQLAEKAVAEIPKQFRDLLYNIEIDVKSVPGPEAGKWRGSSRLLGLYGGLPREAMASPFSGSYLPARIVLYQRNIQSLCETEVDLVKRIRLTLRHEIAHHFGFSEGDIRRRWPEGA